MRGAETRTAKLYEAQRDSLTIYKKATRNHIRNIRKGITGEEFLNVTNNTGVDYRKRRSRQSSPRKKVRHSAAVLYRGRGEEIVTRGKAAKLPRSSGDDVVFDKKVFSVRAIPSGIASVTGA